MREGAGRWRALKHSDDLSIGERAACRRADYCGAGGKGDDLLAAQDPDEPHAVVSSHGSAGIETEQVLGRPTERLGLLAPLAQEPAPVIDCISPASDWNGVRTPPFEGGKGLENASLRMSLC
jgi:hypothetical protein